MRAMRSPWGIALAVAAAALAALLALSTVAVLLALTLFLVRKSRAVSPPTAAR